jgi:hypothetical protein
VHGTTTFALLFSLAGLAGCARGTAPDFYVHGTGVVVDTQAPFAHRPDLPARIESTMGAALQYWGGRWSDLAGSTVTLAGSQHVMCGGSASSLGCYDGDIRITTVDPGIGTFSCVEQTVLVHEIGHAVIGDPNHEDPRWMELEPVADALAGRTGYAADGETDCTIWLSVWRHLRGRQ